MTYFLGLTGGIATGKSTAVSFFKRKNIPIIDTDAIAHQLMEIGGKSYQAIVAEFGKKILGNNQVIDRAKLAKIVFSDPDKLKLLNSITHPLILEEVKKQQAFYIAQNKKLVIIDVPLLFESNWDKMCDASLVISLKYSDQLKRLMKRNGYSEEVAKKRIDSQMPMNEKISLANYNIDNSGSIKDLEKQLSDLLIKINS